MTRIGSLCSGYEGLGMAIESVIGGDLAFVADNDPGASALLAHRYPDTPNLGDITTIDWVSLGIVDILSGGYPCQPFSQAGRRLGTADERHIWPHIVTAINTLRPGMVILENVTGHLTLGFDGVLADLAGLGYDAEWVVVTASAAGACHRRARLFILAFPATGRIIGGEPVAVIEDGAWIEPRESLFGTVPFTGRIPPSGSMAGGRVYAAEAGPTEAGSGLLKTPTAQLAVNGGSQHPDKRRAGGHGPTLADQVEHELLPTPTARENGGSNARHGDTTRGDDLPEAIRYLPTPRAADGMTETMETTRARMERGARHRGTLEEAAALLPTPNATDGKGRSAPAGRTRVDGRTRGADVDLPEAVAQLLPTPAARDGKGRDMPGRAGGKSLPETLLPTPRATDGTKGGPNQRGSSGDLMLPSVVMGLLPTPTAADGDRVSLAYERGNPTLLGALLPTPQAADSRRGSEQEMGGQRPSGQKRSDNLGTAAALLPTPQATDGQGGPRTVPDERTHRGADHGPRLRDVAPALLPTPTAGDAKASGSRNLPGSKAHLGVSLTDALTAGNSATPRRLHGDLPPVVDTGRLLPTPTSNVSGRTGEQHMAMREAIGRGTPSQLEAAAQLLPTPSAGNFNDGESPEHWQQRKDFHAGKETDATRAGMPLTIAAQRIAGETDWGPYEAAIRRWEAVTGRQAPPPTVPGRTGERLNPALPEFMMGLPAGWITEVPGLSRNAMLKLAGNGCVPQQVALALTILLDRAGISLTGERAA